MTTENFDGLYIIRPFVETDKNFIINSFLLGMYYGDSWFSKIPKRIFMNNYKKVITSLISHPAVTINVACLPDEPDVILGYSIVSKSPETLHFVYVKDKWRRRGIGRKLTPKTPEYVSHLTPLGESLLHKLETKPIFNPFL